MRDKKKKLTPKQAMVITTLVAGNNIRDAAIITKTAESSIHRWLKNPEFHNAYREQKLALMEHVFLKVQSVCTDAINILKNIMENEDSTDSSRVTAAKALLDYSIKGYEFSNFEDRISALEMSLERDKRNEK